MKTTRRKFLAYTGAGLIAVACGPTPPSTTAGSGTPGARVPTGEFKVAVPVKVPTLDPHGAQSVEDVSHTVLQHVMEPLVRREPANGNLVAAHRPGISRNIRLSLCSFRKQSLTTL